MFQILVNLIQGMMTRSASLGDFSGIDSGTIAGYTGHIPNSRDAFGNSYTPIMNNSLETFRRSRSSKEELRQTKMNPGYKLERTSSADLLPKIKKVPSHKQIDRGVISGYTGFIPKLQHRFAKSYLNRVDEARSLPKNWQSSDVKIAKQYNTIYHNTGCIPKYTGFLPGHQFRHAQTYGESSRSIDTK